MPNKCLLIGRVGLRGVAFSYGGRVGVKKVGMGYVVGLRDGCGKGG